MAEYMNEDDQIAALKSWWDENGTALVIGLVLVIGGVIGWRAYSDFSQGASEGASAAYQRYLELRDAPGSDSAAIDTVIASLDGEYAGTSYQVLSLLHRATDDMARNDLDGARAHLKQSLAAADDRSLADLTRVRLARVEHQMGDDPAALATLGGVKGTGFKSYAAEIKGDILLKQGKKDDALAAYRAAAAFEDADGDRIVLKLKIADLTPPGSVTDAP